MSKLLVKGMRRLEGRIRISGAKNAILPIIAASLLTDEKVVIEDCPHLLDVHNMLSIMEMIGCTYEQGDSTLTIDTSTANKWEMPEKLAKELRSSIFMLGPVLGRFKKACFTYPGGCEIGNRPINLHIQGLMQLNVVVQEEHGLIICDGSNMKAADIHLDYPSVGATENLMMIAVGIPGRTQIFNAAREPEIMDLQLFLTGMGAKVKGAGTSTIVIEGVERLHGVHHTLMPDRIVAGTYMVAAAITAGDVLVENICQGDLQSILAKLQEAGCILSFEQNSVRVQGPDRPREMHLIETLPYPGFPTDMQAQFMILASVAKGTSIIVENVFENRFKHAAEIRRMGAAVTIKDRMAIVRGVPDLMGAEVAAHDLRGGAALVLAGLRATDQTIVNSAEYIDRGYACLEKDLNQIGAQIVRIP